MLFVISLLLGEKNGRKFGKKLNIAVINVGERSEQLARSSWQEAVGEKQLAKSSWQEAVGKKQLAKSSWQKAKFLNTPQPITFKPATLNS